MTNDRIEPLEFLKGEAVIAITFLHQYLQVELTSATLSCYPGPVVLGAAADFTIANPDYKNQLCQLLQQTIKELTETEKGLVLTFANHELLFEKDGDREILVITNGEGDWYSYPDLELHRTD